MHMSVTLPSRLVRIWDQVRAALDVVKPAPGLAAPRSLAPPPKSSADIITLCEMLLDRRDENAGLKLVAEILDRYASAGEDERCSFLNALAERFGPDEARLQTAIAAYQASPDDIAYRELQVAVEARRQRLIRLLNFAPNGTYKLVQMRADAIKLRNKIPKFAALDSDFGHILRSWFNRGFLVLKQIDWHSPAQVLAKIIQYEAVHDIKDWSDLQSRIDPPDRRCFAFFHPQMADEPLIFIEVALTTAVPATIASVLTSKRQVLRAEDAKTAVFYSISNCSIGLRGIPFGNFLIKQVVEVLRKELPNLETFVTLSPVPGFAGWLSRSAEIPAGLDNPRWQESNDTAEPLRPTLTSLVARYLLEAKDEAGLPLDPVARFHLGNGARLNRVNWLGDVSSRGMKQAHGFMVNYLYDLKCIEANQEAIAVKGTIDAAPAVRDLLKKPKERRPVG